MVLVLICPCSAASLKSVFAETQKSKRELFMAFCQEFCKLHTKYLSLCGHSLMRSHESMILLELERGPHFQQSSQKLCNIQGFQWHGEDLLMISTEWVMIKVTTEGFATARSLASPNFSKRTLFSLFALRSFSFWDVAPQHRWTSASHTWQGHRRKQLQPPSRCKHCRRGCASPEVLTRSSEVSILRFCHNTYFFPRVTTCEMWNIQLVDRKWLAKKFLHPCRVQPESFSNYDWIQLSN